MASNTRESVSLWEVPRAMLRHTNKRIPSNGTLRTILMKASGYVADVLPYLFYCSCSGVVDLGRAMLYLRDERRVLDHL